MNVNNEHCSLPHSHTLWERILLHFSAKKPGIVKRKMDCAREDIKIYSLWHNCDLNKANEEEDYGGTSHICTKSIVHLFGVLQGKEPCVR